MIGANLLVSSATLDGIVRGSCSFMYLGLNSCYVCQANCGVKRVNPDLFWKERKNLSTEACFHVSPSSWRCQKKSEMKRIDTKVSMTGLPKCTWWLRATIRSVM
jgi:hypothetical protein